MAIRKSIDESFVVKGTRETIPEKCETALKATGFSKIKTNKTLFQIEGTYHKFSVWGEIILTLLPEGNDTKITAKATANVDNLYALFRSPAKRILTAFKEGIT